MFGRIVVLAALVAAPSMAQGVLSEADARRALFNERRAEVVIHTQGFVTESEAAVLRDAAVGNVPFYGAIAVAPDLGVGGQATSAAGNHHNAQSANAAALAECNGKRGRAGRECVIVAEVRPHGWEARAFQLSAGATGQFKRDYRRGGGDKAFAISPNSGGFGIGRGAGAAAAAIAACTAAGGTADCVVVIQD